MTKGETPKMNSSLKLLVPREEAIRSISQQIEKGRGFRDQEMFSMMDLESALESRVEWLENNVKMFKRLFNNPSLLEEYYVSTSIGMDSAITFTLKQKYLKDDMNEQIGRLESLLERVKFIPEMTGDELMEQKLQEELMKHEPPKPVPLREVPPKEAPTGEMKIREEPSKEEPLIEKPPKKELLERPFKGKPLEEEPLKGTPVRREPPREKPLPSIVSNQRSLPGSNILLIHGRDEMTKESVLHFLEQLGLRTLNLREEPEGGGNLIEQFGGSSNIDFAIVLFTPDDITSPRHKPKERQARVSQNVLFEFGYFLGKLGNARVCCLYQEGVEILPDYPAVVSIPMDSKGVWRLLVAKEIKQAGIEIDLNKAI